MDQLHDISIGLEELNVVGHISGVNSLVNTFESIDRVNIVFLSWTFYHNKPNRHNGGEWSSNLVHSVQF